MMTYETLPKDDGNAFGTVVGASLAKTITGQLGVRLQFPDRTAELQELGVLAEALLGLEISEPELARVLESEQAAITTAAQETRLNEHDTMLAKDKILTRDTADHEAESYVWQSVSPESKTTFANILDDIRVSLQVKQPEEVSETPAVADSIELEMVSLLETKVSAMLEDLKNNIPLPVRPNAVRRIGKLAAKATGLAAGHPYYREYISPKRQVVINSSKDPARVSRKARELNKLLGELTDDPHGFLARLYIENQKSELEQQAVELLDKQIVDVSRPYVAARKAGRRVLRRQRPEVDPDELPSPAEIANVEAAVANHSEAATTNREEVLETLGTYNLLMPWMPDGTSKVEVRQLIRDGQTVYITHGLTPKLKSISDDSRSKVQLTEAGLNQFDSIANLMARAVASGVMPYQNNSLRQILQNTKRPPFDTIPIWFPFDISPNAPRFYFTLKKMSELTESRETDPKPLDANKYCVVVLAETDKANQLDVLNTLTKGTKRHLRSRGSGSI